MKYMDLFFVLFVLSSCSIKINSHNNENRDFRTNLNVVKFVSGTENFIPGQFVEMDSKSIRSIAAKNNTTIFYMLAPWCGPCVKKFIENYANIDSLSKSKNVSLVVLNNSYGFERTIEKTYKKVNLTSPIYVLDNAVYSKDIDANTADFLKEVCTNCVSNSNGFILVLSGNAEVKYFTNDLSDYAVILDNLDTKL